MALMLAVTKQLPVQQGHARAGLGPPLLPDALELDGRTLGLVGLGRIARRVAVAAHALGHARRGGRSAAAGITPR